MTAATTKTMMTRRMRKNSVIPKSTPVSYTHLDGYKRQDPDAQKLVRDCEEYLEEGNSLELDWNEREEIIRRETIPPADNDICLLYTSRCV